MDLDQKTTTKAVLFGALYFVDWAVVLKLKSKLFNWQSQHSFEGRQKEYVQHMKKDTIVHKTL